MIIIDYLACVITLGVILGIIFTPLILTIYGAVIGNVTLYCTAIGFNVFYVSILWYSMYRCNRKIKYGR